MEMGNQMQNYKIETISELIYEDGIIWSALIFIKIIGSDTLWFPLPPSEVLSHILLYGKIYREAFLLEHITVAPFSHKGCGRNIINHNQK